MKKLGLAVAVLSTVAIMGCLEMGTPSEEKLLDMRDFVEGCPAGYSVLMSTLTSCPEAETCTTLNDGTICIKQHVDTSGGDGVNCDAGWITVSSSEASSCQLLEDDQVESVDELDAPTTGSYYCAQGRVSGRYCRYVPPETSDSRVNVMTEQRCTAAQSVPSEDTLRIHIIDVANGDSIWIQTPTGQNVLIDGGDSGAFGVTSGGPIVTDYLSFHGFEKGSTFDAVFLTHPHSDHFGGLSNIFSSYSLKNYIDPMALDTTEVDSSLYASWISKVRGMVDESHLYMPAEEKLSATDAMPSDFFGPDVKAEYLFSRKTLTAANGNNKNVNTSSIIFRLTYAGVSMLFTGDATDVDEAAVIDKAETRLSANFLKVCHHGSDTSSTSAFLHAIYDAISSDQRGAYISSGRRSFSGSYIPAITTLNRLIGEGFVTLNQLYSTSAGDDGKVESEAYRDDNILIVIQKDGSWYSCYSGTN